MTTTYRSKREAVDALVLEKSAASIAKIYRPDDPNADRHGRVWIISPEPEGVRVTLRLPADIHQAMVQSARESRRSLNAEIIRACEAFIGAE